MICQILLTIAGTVISGTIVFAGGQLLQRLILEPIQEQRKSVARIAQALTVHRYAYLAANSYDKNPDSKRQIDSTSAEIRKLAAELRAGYSLIPANDVFAELGLVPSRETVRIVALYLIRWQTFASEKASQSAVENIAKKLNVEFISSQDKDFNEIMVEAAKTPGQ